MVAARGRRCSLASVRRCLLFVGCWLLVVGGCVLFAVVVAYCCVLLMRLALLLFV